MWQIHGSCRHVLATLSLMITNIVSVAGVSSHGIVLTDYALCVKLHNVQAKVRPEYDHRYPSRRVIHVNTTLQVRLTRNPLEFRPFEYLWCKMEFVASNPDHRLLLTWHYFSVGEGKNGKDWLHVLDAESDLDLSGAMWGTIGKSQPKLPPTHDYRSIGRGITLAYRGHPNVDSFIVQLTAFTDLDKTGLCGPQFHKCRGGGYNICIRRSLLCNGVNNCGELNYSDESEGCYPDTKPSVTDVSRQPDRGHSTPVGLIGALLGIFVTGIILLIAATTLYCWKKRRQRHWVSGRQVRVPSTSATDINHRHPVVQNEYTQLPCHTLPRTKRPVSASMSHPRPAGATLNGTRPFSTAFERSHSHPAPRTMFNGSGPVHDSRSSVGDISHDELAARPLLAVHRPSRVGAHNGHVACGHAPKRRDSAPEPPYSPHRDVAPAECDQQVETNDAVTPAPFPNLIDDIIDREESPEPPPLPPHRRTLPHTSTRRRPPPIISHYQGPSYTASSGQSPTQPTPTANPALDAGEYIRVAAPSVDGQIYYYLDDIAPEYHDIR